MNKMEPGIVNAADINLSGKVIVSDPCYGRGVWCMAKAIAVKPGTYTAYIIKQNLPIFGIRVGCIAVFHNDYLSNNKARHAKWKPYDGVIGVDSGQCGIFDDAVYPVDVKSTGTYDDETSFYGECCKITLDEMQSGILKSGNGVVSASGFGDGSYQLLCLYHKGERVALMVDFNITKVSTLMRALLSSRKITK